MSEALERDAAAAGLAAGKGAGPKFPRNGPAGSVQSVEEARFVKFVENTARLANQSMSRVRWCEAALFEFIVVQRDWFVVKIAADMNKKYDGKLASAVNGAARKAIHKTTRHCYIWSECVQQYWKQLEETGKAAEAPALGNYIAEIKAKTKMAGVDCKCFRVLDVWDKAKVKLCVRFNPGTQANTIWEHLRKDAVDNWTGEQMEGTAPRTKMEKEVLKNLHERGVIDDPKLGDFVGFSA